MSPRVAPLAALALAALSCAPQQSSSARAAASVTPSEVYCGENDCTWLFRDGACQAIAAWLHLPGQFSDVRVSTPLVGVTSVTVDGQTYTVDLQEDGTTFDWTATRPVSLVAASAGFDSNVYAYTPPATSDTGLVAWYRQQLTQVLFCLEAAPQPGLSVSTTASAGFTRTWGWHILKSSPTTSVTAAVGATVDVDYAVTVDATPLDSAFVVTGTISVHNPATVDATGVTIAASLGGAPLAPDCGTFEGTLAAGGSLTCTWSATPAAAVDATAVVTVSSGGADVGASATAAFGAPTAVVDPCVLVTDDRAGGLGTVCAASAPATFSYRLPVGPYASCDASGEGYSYANTASFAAPSGATGSSTWTVQVRVPCAAGCTLTQGYWKTHSQQGPAPYDPRWRNVGPLQEETVFFLSGQTWLQVFATPVQGSAYYALAHQYMAAKLNVLAGAAPDALGNTLAVAEAFFAANGPATRLTPAQRSDVLALATLLDQFNGGQVGPGHCN